MRDTSKSNRRFKKLGLLAASLLVLAACSSSTEFEGDEDDVASSGDAVSAGAGIDAFFGVPRGDGKPDRALEDKLVALIDQAAPGSVIRGTYFHFSRMRVAEALVTAHKARQIDVRMVFNDPAQFVEDDDDRGEEEGAIDLLKKKLPAGSVTICKRGKGSCIGDNIDHNKFMLFSRLKNGAKDVVMQSSANVASSKMHNNMIVARGDSALYQGYLAYFKDLERQELNLGYYREINGDHVLAFVYPRSKGDTVVSVLDNVRCQTGVSKIRVAMAFFAEGRSEVAQRLVDLKVAGCDVKVLLREGGKGTAQAIIDRLRAGDVEVGLYPSGSGNNIHSKYLLIDSPYQVGTNDVRPRKLVYAGSHNYTDNALRHNDEVMIRVDDANVYAAFVENWKTIKSQTK